MPRCGRLPLKSGAGTCGQPPEANYRFLLRAWTPSVNQIPDRSKRLLFALSAAALILSDPNVSTYLRRAVSALLRSAKIEARAFVTLEFWGIPGRGSKHRRRLHPQVWP